jgi:uncharacterized protein
MQTSAGNNRKTALITGASAGIGKAFAEELARNGYDLVLVARRRERIEEIGAGLQAAYGITATALATDLSDPHAPVAIFEKLQRDNIAIDVLVNNAGYALSTKFSAESWNTHDMFLNVIVTSVVRLCHLFIPGMKVRGQGQIINIASFVAYMAGTPGDLYVGAKSFIVKFSQSLYLELADAGIQVTVVCPGLTRSEFHDVMGVREDVNKLPGIFWMDAQTVARLGYAAAMKGKPVCIPGLVNKALVFLMRVTPETILLGVVRLILKAIKKKFC